MLDPFVNPVQYGVAVPVLSQSNHHQLPWTDAAVPLRIRGRLIQMSPDDVEKIDIDW